MDILQYQNRLRAICDHCVTLHAELAAAFGAGLDELNREAGDSFADNQELLQMVCRTESNRMLGKMDLINGC